MTKSDADIYAETGVALRWAQLFEAEIVTVALFHGIARGQFHVRAEAEEFIRKADKGPLSKLLQEILAHVRFEPDVTGTFQAAIEARNSFVHRFFWDRAEAFADAEQHPKLLGELRELTQLFFSAHKFAEMLRHLYFKQCGTNVSA